MIDVDAVRSVDVVVMDDGTPELQPSGPDGWAT